MKKRLLKISKAAMIIYFLGILLHPDTSFAIGGTGVRNGPGPQSLSKNLFYQPQFFPENIERFYDFGAGVNGTSPMLRSCPKAADQGFPDIPHSLAQKIVFKNAFGKGLRYEDICQSVSTLKAYRSLLNALYLLEQDPIFLKVMELSLQANRKPLQVYLQESPQRVRESKIEWDEQAWVSQSKDDYILNWGPPIFLNERNGVIQNIFGRWEVPLLMHELGHILTSRLAPQWIREGNSTHHDCRAFELQKSTGLQDGRSEDWQIGSFLEVRSSKESSFFESISNLLELPFLWTHPMKWDGISSSYLENSNELHEKNIDQRLKNEALLTTTLHFFVNRPYLSANLSSGIATYPADIIVPKAIDGHVILSILNSLSHTKAEPSIAKLMQNYDEENNVKEGESWLSSFFHLDWPAPEKSFSSFLEDLERNEIQQIPFREIPPGEMSAAKEALSKLKLEIEKIKSFNQDLLAKKIRLVKIQKIIADGKFKNLTIVEIIELKSAFQNGNFWKNNEIEFEDVYSRMQHLSSLNDWNYFKLRELDPFLTRMKNSLEMIRWCYQQSFF